MLLQVPAKSRQRFASILMSAAARTSVQSLPNATIKTALTIVFACRVMKATAMIADESRSIERQHHVIVQRWLPATTVLRTLFAPRAFVCVTEALLEMDAIAE